MGEWDVWLKPIPYLISAPITARLYSAFFSQNTQARIRLREERRLEFLCLCLLAVPACVCLCAWWGCGCFMEQMFRPLLQGSWVVKQPLRCAGLLQESVVGFMRLFSPLFERQNIQ